MIAFTGERIPAEIPFFPVSFVLGDGRPQDGGRRIGPQKGRQYPPWGVIWLSLSQSQK